VTIAAAQPAVKAQRKYIEYQKLVSSGLTKTFRFSLVVTSTAAFGMFIKTVTQ
jgi:hypothetical protein